MGRNFIGSCGLIVAMASVEELLAWRRGGREEQIGERVQSKIGRPATATSDRLA